MPVQTVIKVRRDTLANWNSTNPVLASGEISVATDNSGVKIGDGTTAWASLPYILAGNATYATSAGSATTASTANIATNAHVQILVAKNSTGSTIAKGVPVYASGANGTNILIAPASNASEATSSKTLGFTMASMANNSTNTIITEGLLSGINTSAATAGDPVWLGVNGALIYGAANKPVAPAHMVFVGVVTRASLTNGEIFVKVQNGFEIEELHNVLITDAADGQILTYEASSGLWKNKAAASGESFHPFLLMGA